MTFNESQKSICIQLNRSVPLYWAALWTKCLVFTKLKTAVLAYTFLVEGTQEWCLVTGTTVEKSELIIWASLGAMTTVFTILCDGEIGLPWWRHWEAHKQISHNLFKLQADSGAKVGASAQRKQNQHYCPRVTPQNPSFLNVPAQLTCRPRGKEKPNLKT